MKPMGTAAKIQNSDDTTGIRPPRPAAGKPIGFRNFLMDSMPTFARDVPIIPS
jgi:hypothetical protein